MVPPDKPQPPLSSLLGAIELSGLAWCYVDLAPDGGFSLPPVDGLCFHGVLHGAVRLAIPGEELVELSAGEAVFVLRGEAHAVRFSAEAAAPPLAFLREPAAPDAPPTILIGAAGGPQARLLSARLDAAFPSGVDRSSLPPVLRVRLDADLGAGASALRSGAWMTAGAGPGSSAILTRMAAVLLAERLRDEPACHVLLAGQQVDPIDQAVRLIAGNPSAAWSVERLAHAVRMGRSNFAAHFTARLGRAPMEVVAEHRMEQAARLLGKGSLKIAEVAELCGYGSEAAFSRRFTRHFGRSPSLMRDELARQAEHLGGERRRQSLLAGSQPAGLVGALRARTRHHPPAISGAADVPVPTRQTFLTPRRD